MLNAYLYLIFFSLICLLIDLVKVSTVLAVLEYRVSREALLAPKCCT